jgi:hypothetical protein
MLPSAHSSHDLIRALPPRRPPRFHNDEANKILCGPVAAVRFEEFHRFRLDSTALIVHKIVDLPIIVECIRARACGTVIA